MGWDKVLCQINREFSTGEAVAKGLMLSVSFIGIVLVGTKPQWELWIRNSKARISVQYKMPIELPKKEEGQEQMEKYINVNAMLIRAGKY